MKYCLDITHHLEGEIDGEDAGVLSLVLLEDVRLHGAAHIFQHHGFDPVVFIGQGLTALFPDIFVHLLVDGRIEKHGQHDGRRSVDGHGDRCVGGAQLEPAIEHFHIVQGADADPGIAHLAVDIRPAVRVVAIEGDRIEGGGEALGLAVGRQHLNRRLVRAGSPSPANMRVGSSPIRFMGKTPAVKGK
jgi:hypothetical protein